MIIVGGGHNGLVAAAYLAKQGLDVLVLERRHVVGGGAITEELVPGFKFSRASYLAGLLRPQIITELGLEKYGFKYLPRDPSSFTPTSEEGKYLMLGSDEEANWQSIAQFSKRDADVFPEYEAFLGRIRDLIEPLLDAAPPNPWEKEVNWKERRHALTTLNALVSVGWKHSEDLVPFYELFTGPASQILDRWFESEVLKSTLATDAVIGAMNGPRQAGSAYVLLHHIMGEAAGRKGVWAYVEGGMGAVSASIAAAAKGFGAEIVTNATVKEIVYDPAMKRVAGVEMEDGTRLEATTVVSNCTPYQTFLELFPSYSSSSDASPFPASFLQHIRHVDYASGVFKINLAMSKLPNFTCCPSPSSGKAGPQHRGTIHFEETVQEIEDAYLEAYAGRKPSTRPVIEMTIPSSLDTTLAPPGKHVASLFVQYAPYTLDPAVGSWEDPHFKEAFAERVFSLIDEKAPGFSGSILGKPDLLSPLDLERVFGLHGGNIFHGSLSLHQLGYTRPAPGQSSYRTPLAGLYLCGAGTHPGGGVMGAPGRNSARAILSDLGRELYKK